MINNFLKDINCEYVLLNIDNWREYYLRDLFEVKNNLQLNKDSFVFNNKKEYPYFTRTVNNNGILGYVDYIGDKYLIEGNCLAIGMMGMEFFYMEKNFYAGQFTKRILLKNKKLNREIALFLLPLLNSYKKIFMSGSVKQFENNFQNKKIKLPSKFNELTNVYEPDWIFIEDYIKKIEKTINNEYLKSIELNLKKISFTQESIDSWKPYKIENLFEIKGSKTTSKPVLEKIGVGEYPYITTTAENQGTSGYYNHFTEIGNVLTFDSAVLGTCFYQEKNFSASDHVELGIPKYHFNKKIGLFLQTVINKTNEGVYHYGHKANQKRIRETIIKLPSKFNELTNVYEHDWNYMENYIDILEQKIFN